MHPLAIAVTCCAMLASPVHSIGRTVQQRGRQDAQWSRPHRYRLQVAAPPTRRAWADAPVVARIQIPTLEAELGITERDLAWDSVLVVFLNDDGTERAIPHKLDFEPGCWRICWRSPVHSDRLRRFRIYFDRQPQDGGGAAPAFIGGCDALSFGRSGVVDRLGVGLWACPAMIDYDRDGRLDMLYSCGDVPAGGTYLYKRLPRVGTTSGPAGRGAIFRLSGRLSRPLSYPSFCDFNGDRKPDLLVTGGYYDDFLGAGLARYVRLPVAQYEKRIRANLYRAADWDNDGVMDLLVGRGDWQDYGWDRGFNERGEWTRGPLHGWVRFYRNGGTSANPRFQTGLRLMAGPWPVDVFGRPGVCVADWDADGDDDLIVGEFLDRIWYFENI